MAYWKVNCNERHYPGVWHAWCQKQIAAVGWPPQCDFLFKKRQAHDGSWTYARKALERMRPGDHVVVYLAPNRVGRIGEVVHLAVQDHEYEPTVPPNRSVRRGYSEYYGELGRRILVRWDEEGPNDPEVVVRLPGGARAFGIQPIRTISELPGSVFRRLRKAVRDRHNWVKVTPSTFSYERSISDFIGTYPWRLEDGMTQYPSEKTRERVFRDGSRSDVLLRDREGKPVVVECKQGEPELSHVRQLRRYLKSVRVLTGRRRVRGILVHGGAGRVRREVKRACRGSPNLELVRYRLDVEFQAYPG